MNPAWHHARRMRDVLACALCCAGSGTPAMQAHALQHVAHHRTLQHTNISTYQVFNLVIKAKTITKTTRKREHSNSTAQTPTPDRPAQASEEQAVAAALRRTFIEVDTHVLNEVGPCVLCVCVCARVVMPYARPFTLIFDSVICVILVRDAY